MENSSNIRPFDFQSSKLFPLLFHLSSELKMCFGLYLQVIVVIGSSVNQRSGHPEILDHSVGSVANLSEIWTGNSFRGPGNNRKSRRVAKRKPECCSGVLPCLALYFMSSLSSSPLPTPYFPCPLLFQEFLPSWIRLGSFPLQSFPRSFHRECYSLVADSFLIDRAQPTLDAFQRASSDHPVGGSHHPRVSHPHL